MGKTLFIIASDYPFGPGEPFLENEVKQIESSFDKIIFLVTSPLSRLNNKKLFYIPDNAEIIIINKKITRWQKLKVIRWVFKRVFWTELKFIRKKLRLNLNLQVIKICLFALAKGFVLKKKIQIQLKQYLNSSENQCYFYSYWCTEHSLGLAFLKLKYPQLIVFTRAHGWDVYYERNNPPYLPFRPFIINTLDMLFTISDNGKKYLTEKIKASGQKITTSKLGTQQVTTHNKFQKQNALCILSIAYIVALKRINLLIDALAILDIDIEWTHIGGGKLFDSTLEYANLKLETKSNIKFNLPGNKSKEEIYQFLSEHYFDCLINTSYTEGIPVSMMEAMSFGIPVIGTNVGGVCEIINDGVNGFLISSDPAPIEIAETILKFQNLTDDEELKFRENAYKTWKEKYNAEKNYTKFVEQILNLKAIIYD